MKTNRELKIIAKIKTDFPTKFGIPRQSGLIPELRGKIIFEPPYRNPEALRGIEGFSHLWLLWEFSESVCDNWSPTVRPPRLGGNKRVGVFATRSPFRPNPIGLSSVKLERIIDDANLGTVLEISGADLMDGTPIYDIKPYIAYTDSHAEALGGFSENVFENTLTVDFPNSLKELLPKVTASALLKILESDPRPAYKADGDRIYSFEFSDYNIKFSVNDNILTVHSLEKLAAAE